MSAPPPPNGSPSAMPMEHPNEERVCVPDAAAQSHAYRRSVLWVFLIYLGIHLFIFRGVLVHLPDLLSGRSVINTSELVPFFDPSSQFFEQAGGAFSDLTNTYEFRVRYSLLTTWMRYYLFLPFTIVLAPFIGAFLSCLFVSEFLRRLLPSIPPKRILYATALTTLFIHLILLPAKITHFYTLILGFDIFVVSLIFFLHGLLLEPKRPVLLLLASSLVALVNPAVHFLVLYPLTVVFFCAGTWILLLITGGKRRGADAEGAMQETRRISLHLWKRILLALVFTALVTILPYGLFVYFYVLRDVGNLTDIVPDTVASIRISSMSLLHQITFDISSVTKNFLTGSYTNETPLFSKLFYFLIALIPFFIPVSSDRKEMRRLRPFLVLLFILAAFAMWASIGYADIVAIPTFHMMLAAIYRQLYLLPGQAAEIGMQLITEVIHVLRFPDRFQFIFLAAMTILMPMGVIVLERECGVRFSPRFRLGKILGSIICATIFFFPLFSNREYRTILFTGDFGGFLYPYNVQPLREMKEALETLPRGKVIVLPPSEGPWIGETGNNETYKFIDKFFIYFLNRPSYNFGLNGDLKSKYWFYLIFQSLSNNEHGWINIFRNLNIRYLVINKELTSPLQSAWYMQNISQSLSLQPQAMPQFFRQIVKNENFVLYEFTDLPQAAVTPLLMNAGWDSFRCIQEESLTLTQRYRIEPLHSLPLKTDGSELNVLAGDQQKLQLDLFAKEQKDYFFRSDQSSFAFMEEHIPSAQYFETIFPMLNLLTASTYNIYQVMIAGPFDTLTTSFVGLIKPTVIRFPLMIKRNGTYEVLLRGVPTQHTLAIRVDHGPMISITTTLQDSSTDYIASKSAPFGKREPANISGISPDVLGSMIPKTIMPSGDQFEYVRLGTVDLTEGKHMLFLHKNDSNPLIIEGVLLLPVGKQAAEIPLNATFRLLSPGTLLE